MKKIVYGNKSEFATQFELDIDDCNGSQWMLGKFCFYINNHRVGDYEMGATLRDVKEYIKDYALHPQRVYAPKLFALSDQEIFDLIYNWFIERDERLNPYIENNTKPEYFRVNLCDEFIDPYFIYKVDSDTQTKFFYGKYNPTTILSKEENFYSILLPREQVDAVLKDTYTELQRIHDLLKAREI